ncbi:MULTISPECIES: hypothetical protein [Priestia]|uniref:hypothetical protein n=1 Tax=Priestia TaxID=2800373 RepID=UPI002079E66A|nr:hypothetical protein [Priestia megaterium]USL37825.1 hypothetical protein LIT34_08050 [Priestia megaterium]
MNNLQGLTSLFNFNGMFGKRNNNRVILLSLLGVGIGNWDFGHLANKRDGEQNRISNHANNEE